MLNTQCTYTYVLAGLYPVIDASQCSTTGTIDVVTSTSSTEQLTNIIDTNGIIIIGIAIIIFIGMFWSGYKLSNGKK